ncbi:MAG: HesA/MoeB/ThiF family protein [Parvibaculum sp.]|uniref:HesA/MoeB/ThiF family protein n=1 Tax=Parvibaculum sp. TaxID=2024848 RepID=UPI0032655F27
MVDARPTFVDTRYNRQELVPQLGSEAQSKLGAGRVVVIGAGGVKSPLLYYLAAAGVGHIRIIDFDLVELSNLNRQILFCENDIGRNKAEAAYDRLIALNSEIEIEAISRRLDEGNALSFLEGFDVIVEGGDSSATRFLVNRCCLALDRPMVHASAQYNYGYVFTVVPHRTACFECIFPDLDRGHGGSVPVFGVATGIAGVLGAGEVIKILTKKGKPIVDGMLSFSGFLSDFLFIPSPRRPNCASCGTEMR